MQKYARSNELYNAFIIFFNCVGGAAYSAMGDCGIRLAARLCSHRHLAVASIRRARLAMARFARHTPNDEFFLICQKSKKKATFR